MIPTVLMCYNKLQGRCWLWILLLVHSHTALVFVGRARTDALNGTYTNQTKPINHILSLDEHLLYCTEKSDKKYEL